jgi:hypothetical protein
MLAKKVALKSKTLLNPASPEWEKLPVEAINMGGTPLASQPSRYIRTAWADRPIGKVRFLNVRAAHNGKDLLFHLEWRDESHDVDYSGRGFPDGAGVLFPLSGDALLTSMGSEKAPEWKDGTWRLVLSRPLAVADQKGETVQLAVGGSTKVAFAVWEGGSGERAGIKAFSKQWRELTLEG